MFLCTLRKEWSFSLSSYQAVLVTHVTYSDPALNVSHYRMEDEEVYLLCNDSTGQPEVWSQGTATNKRRNVYRSPANLHTRSIYPAPDDPTILVREGGLEDYPRYMKAAMQDVKSVGIIQEQMQRSALQEMKLHLGIVVNFVHQLPGWYDLLAAGPMMRINVLAPTLITNSAAFPQPLPLDTRIEGFIKPEGLRFVENGVYTKWIPFDRSQLHITGVNEVKAMKRFCSRIRLVARTQSVPPVPRLALELIELDAGKALN